jgi:hypothetical protein
LSVIRDNRIPKPGGGTWNAEDAQDLVQDLFVSGRVNKLVLSAADDADFLAKATVATRNMIVDRLRETGQAAVRERVIDVLNKGAFVKHRVKGEDSYGLVGQDGGERYQGNRVDLRLAADRAPVRLYPFNPDAERASSFAPREDIERLLTTVLAEAGAPVPVATLVEVVGQRVDLGRVPDQVDADPVLPMTNPEAALIGAEIADEIWARLTPTQRQLLPHLDASAREAAQDGPLKKSAMAVGRKGIVAIASEYGVDLNGADRTAVLRRLMQLHEIETGQRASLSRETGQEP